MSEKKSRVDSRKLKARRCPAKLQVMGESISCRYNRSSETLVHPPEHEAEVILNDRQGIIVRWQYWRVVKPPSL